MSSKNKEILQSWQKSLAAAKNSFSLEEIGPDLEELEKGQDKPEDNFQKACGLILMSGFYGLEAEKQFQKALEKNQKLNKVIKNLKLLQSQKSDLQQLLQQIKF